MTQPICIIDGCDEPHRSRGWCRYHYQRWHRYGNPLAGGPAHARGTPAERFWTKVDTTGICWEWTAALNPGGYGRLPLGRTNVAAHRWAYEHLIGPVPENVDLDHLCRNRRCVNPDHLEVVTGRENILRGYGPPALNARKTHCPEGHEYTPENTRLYRGYRYCKTCQREHSRKRMAAKRARERGRAITVGSSSAGVRATS